MALLLVGLAMVPMVSATIAEIDLGNDPEINAILNNASALETLPWNLQNASTDTDKENEAIYMNNYVSPSRQIIDLMKKKGCSDTQITNFLTEQGYGWDPKTGASWKGKAPTPEEQKIIDQIRGPGYSPFSRSVQTNTSSVKSITSLRGAGATMNLVDQDTYFGINLYMSPGEMVITPSGTYEHVVTTHVGKKTPSGGEDWTEAGVARSVNDPTRSYFTYDNDEGGWQFHGAADATLFKNYKIYVSDTHESAGYVYNIWIDSSWVRSGHLYYRQTKYNCANEIWADGSNPFSSDGTSSYFQNAYIYKSTGTQWWGDYTATSTFFSPDNPPYESHYMSGNSYKFITWV